MFGIILEHARELERAKRQAREGNYDGSTFSAIEIKGKVFGALGVGRIGTRVAEFAQGFEADVRYWNRSRKENLESKRTKYEETALFQRMIFSHCILH